MIIEFTVRETVRRTATVEVDPERFEEVTGYPFREFWTLAEDMNDEAAADLLEQYIGNTGAEAKVSDHLDFSWDEREWVDFEIREEEEV